MRTVFIRVYNFYKDFQPLFREKHASIACIGFIKYSGLEITKNLSNCLLIFDNSCEEIFNDKANVKIATSGRHCKFHVIYVKHYLFHQSKWSRNIDLNTTQVILFKSLRDVQQIEDLGKQLNCLQLLKDAYKLATAEPYGRLIIDLDPKTSQALRFASQIFGPDHSIFYIPSQEAVMTPITNEKEKFAYPQAVGKKRKQELHH